MPTPVPAPASPAPTAGSLDPLPTQEPVAPAADRPSASAAAPATDPPPTAASPPTVASPPARADASARPVVVRPGDTLWAIAAGRLGPGAGDSAVASEWPRWYAANRAVIGPDPDLILPGQRLTPPAPVQH